MGQKCFVVVVVVVEGIDQQSQDDYAKLFSHPLSESRIAALAALFGSESRIAALAALFGWNPPSDRFHFSFLKKQGRLLCCKEGCIVFGSG